MNKNNNKLDEVMIQQNKISILLAPPFSVYNTSFANANACTAMMQTTKTLTTILTEIDWEKFISKLFVDWNMQLNGRWERTVILLETIIRFCR